MYTLLETKKPYTNFKGFFVYTLKVTDAKLIKQLG